MTLGTEPSVPTVTLPDGLVLPALGLGTWHMGEKAHARSDEVAALKAGIDLGLAVIDTAEMYAGGGAEMVVAEAISGQRDKVFLVSKVMPQNASLAGTIAACEASLKRLRTDHLDLYLLHWRGGVPLGETIRAFAKLKADGKIARWGVSNFDASDMAELPRMPEGSGCAANQVLYHLGERGVEWRLLPMLQELRQPLMAYCPLGGGDLAHQPLLKRIARKHGVTAAAVAIAFLLGKPGVMPIPKSSNAGRVLELARARSVRLDPDDMSSLDGTFPPPGRETPLGMA